MKIPKIIHQIWSGIDEPLPLYFEELGETWKRDYPDWKYILWNNEMMTEFIVKHYPGYLNTYESFPYNIQRWDSIRYLILEKMGGMYVDFDYESIAPLNDLVRDETCCFAADHVYGKDARSDDVFYNAMMLSVPGHFFMRRIIENIFEKNDTSNSPEGKFRKVLDTTGPGFLIELYRRLTPEEQKAIYIIPAKYVTPFDRNQAVRFRRGEESEELDKCLGEAYAVHYYFGDWLKSED